MPASAPPPSLYPLAQLNHVLGDLPAPLSFQVQLFSIYLLHNLSLYLALTLLRSSTTSLLVLLELFSAVVWSLSVRSISSSIWRISVVTYNKNIRAKVVVQG